MLFQYLKSCVDLFESLWWEAEKLKQPLFSVNDLLLALKAFKIFEGNCHNLYSTEEQIIRLTDGCMIPFVRYLQVSIA
jgi:hypothetical protein